MKKYVEDEKLSGKCPLPRYVKFSDFSEVSYFCNFSSKMYVVSIYINSLPPGKFFMLICSLLIFFL